MDIKTLAAALALVLVIGVSGCSREQSDWEKARASNDTDSYELFVKKYPNGSFTPQAQARLKELYEDRDWQKARDADTPEAYQAFLNQYPEGKWTKEARIRVENFSLAQAPSTAPAIEAGPAVPAPSSSAAKTKPAPPAAPAAAHGGAKSAGAAAASPAPKAAAKASAKSSAPGAGGSTVIQLGAYKTGTAAANRHWALLEKKFPSALKGLTPTVKPSSPGASPLYRLQVTGLTHAAARSICKALKAKGSACVVMPKVRHS
jgi:hypothetical protein